MAFMPVRTIVYTEKHRPCRISTKPMFYKILIFIYSIFLILAFRRCRALSVDFSSRPSTLAIWL